MQNSMNLPPAYIVTCEANPLRDDGKVIKTCLEMACAPVKSDHYLGLPYYPLDLSECDRRAKFIGNLVGGRKWVVGQM